jgi:outer membrane protein TolC
LKLRLLWSATPFLAGLAALLPLCACTTLAPAPAAPQAVDVPAGWLAADAAGAATVSDTALIHWWQRFDDPLLGTLVGRALQHSTSVNGAQAALQQAQALRDVAAAALAPTLDASASAQRGTAGGHSTGNQFQAGLDASWAPDVFGARRAGVDAADAVVLASSASLGDMQLQIAAEVALDCILLRAAQARSVIANDNLASQLETLQITEWRQQAGLVTWLEVEQARAAVAQGRAALPPLQTSVQQTRHALAVLTGQPPAALQAETVALPGAGQGVGAGVGKDAGAGAGARAGAVEGSAGVPQARAGLPLAVPAETLRQRADVRAAEYQVAAALARVGQAQAQRWPSFAIGGSLGVSALTLGTLANSASVLGSLLASVSLPLFDGGALRAQVRSQQAALAQAQQVYRGAVLVALKDVEDALVALRGDRLRLASLRVAAASAASAALLARQRYSSGLVDFQTVLETQRNQYTTLDGVVSVMADLSSDDVRLFKALGGGWQPVEGPTAAITPLTPAGTATP